MKKRDILFVCTNGANDEKDLLRFAKQTLGRNGYTIWNQSDWYSPDEESNANSRRGSALNVRRLAAGSKEPFSKSITGEVNIKMLANILKVTPIIVLVNPTRTKITKSVRFEMDFIDKAFRLSAKDRPGRLIQCAFSRPGKTHTLVEGLDYSDCFLIRTLTNAEPQKSMNADLNREDMIHLLVNITTHLFAMAVEASVGEAKRGNDEIADKYISDELDRFLPFIKTIEKCYGPFNKEELKDDILSITSCIVSDTE